jgi:hypothetical protein
VTTYESQTFVTNNDFKNDYNRAPTRPASGNFGKFFGEKEK